MAKTTSKPPALLHLSVHDPETGDLNVIIDTPRGSRNKYSYEERYGLFVLKGVLFAGASFPYDFGFIPSTLGGDGDPLDVLVLMDEAAFTGALVPARLIGVIEAEQTEQGETERNDRLIAVAAKALNYRDIKSLDGLSAHLLDEIEHFFISYNTIKGKVFRPLGRFGPAHAARVVEEGAALYRRRHRTSSRKRAAKKR